MNILSLFDGMSCGQIALNRLGIKYKNYFASEVDKWAIKITQKNFPNTIQIGDVKKVFFYKQHNIDLLMGGSPCQGFSFAGKQLNFKDPRSKLFFEFVRVLKQCKPRKFLFENVRMKKEYQDIISGYLGCEPININSNLFSAQNRNRFYWTNIPVDKLPEDKGLTLDKILYHFPHGFTTGGTRHYKKTPCVSTQFHNNYFVIDKGKLILSQKAVDYMNRKVSGGRNHWDFKHHSNIRNKKSSTVVANYFKGIPYNVLKDWDCIRKFHPVECERLQTIPDNYTYGVSNTQRYKMIGNGWTTGVICHLMKNIIPI